MWDSGWTLYNYFRDYDPSTGRYVESDPIGLEGGINTYVYAYANPVVYVDPLGATACSSTGPFFDWIERLILGR